MLLGENILKKKSLAFGIILLFIVSALMPIVFGQDVEIGDDLLQNIKSSDVISRGWIEKQKLLASDAGGWENFGCSVSINGDTAVIGAKWDDDNGGSSGSAYVFRYDGNSWVDEQ